MDPRRALLVIDMQLCAFDGEITPPIEGGDALLGSVAALIATCRANDVPIVFVQTCAASGQPYARDAHGWAIHPTLAPQTHDPVVFKQASSGFDGTELHDHLTKLRTGGVITCGIWSEFCVTNTSVSALNLGYEVWVAADAHGTVANAESAASDTVARQNDFLRRTQARVLTVAEIKDALGRAGA